MSLLYYLVVGVCVCLAVYFFVCFLACVRVRVCLVARVGVRAFVCMQIIAYVCVVVRCFCFVN